MSLKEKVLATMKSRETESNFELYVTRTPGYLWAKLFEMLHIHPIVVTLASMAIGAASGFFFWYDDLRMNLIGMMLLVCANWFDCADGQLARMTGKKTLIGRILDGFAGDVLFFSIYFFLCARMTEEWGMWIWILAAWSGLRCHGRQCAIADYYRNIHLWLLPDTQNSEFATSEQEKRTMKEMKWLSRDWFHKLYLFFYAIYTEGQEAQSPKFQKLYRYIQEHYPKGLPTEFKKDFAEQSRPLMKYTNMLTIDLRVGVLFASLAIGMPWVYMVFESTVLEGLRFYTIKRHENICEATYQKLTA